MSMETPNPTEGADLQNTPWEIDARVELGDRDVLQLANSRVAASCGGGRE